jgi:hypothetical protein
VTFGSKGFYNGARHVLVCEQPHSLCWERIEFLGSKDTACIRQAGSNVFGRQSWIILEDLVIRPTLGKQFDHKFDCDAGSPYDGFSCQYPRIQDDSFFPGHARIIPPSRFDEEISHKRHKKGMLESFQRLRTWRPLPMARMNPLQRGLLLL